MSDSKTGSAEAEQPPNERRKEIPQKVKFRGRHRDVIDASPTVGVDSTVSVQAEGSSAMKTTGSDAPTDLGEEARRPSASPALNDPAKRPVTELRKRQLEQWITQALVSGARQPK